MILIFIIITNNATVNFTISDKRMGLYELNKKITVAREGGFIFNQINELTKKIFSNLSHINIHYHLKLGLLPLHRQFFIKISQNTEYNQIFAMIEEIPFILHVVIGIHIKIHNFNIVYLHEFKYEKCYSYMYICTNKSNYSYTCTNTILSIFSKMVIYTKLKFSG